MPRFEFNCFISVCVFIASTFGLEANTPPEFLWAKVAGSSTDDFANGVAVDAAGNSVTVGSFWFTGNFLGTSLASSGADDIFLLKLNSSGAPVWAKRAGGTGADEAYATALDGAGNVYAAGRFTGTATFDTTNLVSAGTHDMFLAKYHANGNLLWARRAGGTDIDYANGVSTDSSGNVFVTGVFTGTANFGGTSLTSSGSKDIFIAKYDTAGNFLWARKAGGTGTDVSFSIATDGSGNAYTVGWFLSTATFSGTSVTALGTQDIFLAKYDGNGNFLWARQAGGSSAYNYGYSVTVDPSGNPCITGSFRSTANFNGTSVTSSGSADIFVAKYGSNGNFLWVQKAGAPDVSSPPKANDDEGYAVTTDSEGNIILTGYFNGTANFSGTNISSSSSYQDVFVAKYSAGGSLIWVRRAGGADGSDYGNSVAMDAGGNAYVPGVFYVSAALGTNNISSAGGRDIFVTKISTTTASSNSPTISDVTDKTFHEDTSSGAIPFIVNDVETPAANLVLSASASNPALLPPSNFVFGGSGTNRTLTINPASNSFGTATVTIVVTDASGATNSDSFFVTINPVNDAPTLNALGNLAVNEDSGPALVNLTGITSGAGNENQVLTITATSSNPLLIPNPTVSYFSPNTTASLSLAPLADATGTATITVTVQDDGGTANGGINLFTRTFSVTVNPVSNAPTISSISNQIIDEDSSTALLPFVIGDLDTSALNLVASGSSSNPSLIPNANIVLGGSGNNRTATISPAANQFGSATIWISVSDGANTVSNSFLVTVNPINDLPTVTGITNRVINEDTPTVIAFDVFDVETSAASLAIAAVSSDTNLVPTANLIFSGTGTNKNVTITPAANKFGSSLITISVNDGIVTTNSSFLLTINSVNDAPTLNILGNLAINEDSGATGINLTGINSGAGNENQNLIVTASSSNPSLIPAPVVTYFSTNSNGSLSLAPLTNANGTSIITVTVQDDGDTANGGTNVFSRTFSVTVNPLNDAPSISDIANQFINQDVSSAPIPFVVGDAETPATSLTLSGTSSATKLIANSGIIFGGSGSNRTVSFNPARGKTGTSTITISVNDGATTILESFLVTVGAGNSAPTISAITDRTTNEDTSTAAIPFTVRDNETAPANLIVWASSSNPNLVPNTNVVFSGTGTNRTFVITPSANQSGTSLISIFVNDGAISTNTSFSITVNPVNDAPVISPITNRTAEVGNSLSVVITATDLDIPADVLTFSFVSAPLGASLTTNGVFNWTPLLAQAPSTNTIILRVSDNGVPSLSSTSSFVVVVAPPPITELPNIEKPQYSGGKTKLSFVAQAGQRYRIDYAGGTNAPWVEWARIPVPSVTTNLTVEDCVYDSNRLYRLVIDEPPARIDRLIRTSEGAQICFAVQAGRTYQVQGQDVLNAENWTVLTNLIPDVSTNSFSFYDARRGQRKENQQFYRLMTPVRLGAFSDIQKTPPVFSFQFLGKAGTSYVVESCYAFAGSLWSSLTNVTPATTTNVMVFDSTPNQQKFYRIRTN